VKNDGFRVSAGDLLGVSSENAAKNLVGFDEDFTQRSVLRRRRFINGSIVFADLPRVTDVIDDFTTDTAPTRFSAAVQIQPRNAISFFEVNIKLNYSRRVHRLRGC